MPSTQPWSSWAGIKAGLSDVIVMPAIPLVINAKEDAARVEFSPVR